MEVSTFFFFVIPLDILIKNGSRFLQPCLLLVFVLSLYQEHVLVKKNNKKKKLVDAKVTMPQAGFDRKGIHNRNKLVSYRTRTLFLNKCPQEEGKAVMKT